VKAKAQNCNITWWSIYIVTLTSVLVFLVDVVILLFLAFLVVVVIFVVLKDIAFGNDQLFNNVTDRQTENLNQNIFFKMGLQLRGVTWREVGCVQDARDEGLVNIDNYEDESVRNNAGIFQKITFCVRRNFILQQNVLTKITDSKIVNQVHRTSMKSAGCS